MTSPLSPQAVCAACGTEGSGRFCAICGATLTSTKCAGCGTPLSPGAHFCHRCGKPVGAGVSASAPTPQDSPREPAATSSLPWAVAAMPSSPSLPCRQENSSTPAGAAPSMHRRTRCLRRASTIAARHPEAKTLVPPPESAHRTYRPCRPKNEPSGFSTG